ncbi:PIG-L family deacetylase [Trinickia sp. LjRoot230]|uniref:PIG-L family deacetylase n=1 Tax=Trinickia sp. LjRoot230 TaxID=3342288 RepID=UPI003ECD88BD
MLHRKTSANAATAAHQYPGSNASHHNALHEQPIANRAQPQLGGLAPLQQSDPSSNVAAPAKRMRRGPFGAGRSNRRDTGKPAADAAQSTAAQSPDAGATPPVANASPRLPTKAPGINAAEHESAEKPASADGPVRADTIHPALRELLDRFVPGWKLGSVFVFLAHPDDESMMIKIILILLAMGVQVHVGYVTQSNGGTAYTSESGIQRPTFAATGKEALFSELYGKLRIAQSLGLLADIALNPDLLSVDVLRYPDRSPYNAPAERSVRYSEIADWNRPHIVEFITEVIARVKPASVLSLRDEEVVHAAHRESATLLQTALERMRANTPPDQQHAIPVHLSAIESGWYEQRHLRPIEAEREITSHYTDEERVMIRAFLAKWFGQHHDGASSAQDESLPACEQPPGRKLQWDAEVLFERLEAAPGTDERIIQFFNVLLNTPLPSDITAALAAKAASSEAPARLSNVKIHEPQIPPHASSEGRRAEGVALLPATTFTDHVGPQTDAWLATLPQRVLRARRGEGPQPYQMTEHEREGLNAFKAPPRHVDAHVPLKTRLRTLKPNLRSKHDPEPYILQQESLNWREAPAEHGTARMSLAARMRALTPSARRDGDRFIAGPRRDSVLYVLSTDQMPDQVIGKNGDDLTLDAHTRPFSSLDSARERAARLIAQNPDSNVAIYRLDGPARELHAGLRRNRLDKALVGRAAMVLDAQGTLYQTTVANTAARYRPTPGEPYGPPPVHGMPKKRMRAAAALALGKIGVTATSAYFGLRYGLEVPTETAMEIMLEGGRAMFAARAGLNAAKSITGIRIAQLSDALGAQREAYSDQVDLLGGGQAAERFDLPALDTLERRTMGLRGIMRGFARHDRAEAALLAETLRISPGDVDAYRQLDSLVNEKLFSADTPIERARRVFWGASYAPSDIAAAGIWLAPQVMLSGLDSVEGTALWLANLATLMFVPVHLSGNGGQRLARSLDVSAKKHHLDPSVPAPGDKLPNFLPGTERLPRFARAALGDLFTYSRLRPDDGRMYKRPFHQRLPEFQMLGATIASAPFAAANALAAWHSIMTGDVGAAAMQAGMVAADATFLRGFWHAYEDTSGANRGRGPFVRRGFVPAIRPPLRGAETKPDDITQPHLVNHGVLRRIDPNIVIAAGMSTQVALQFMLAI